MGYISTMNLLGRQRELHLYGPPDLQALVELNLRLSESFLDYQLHFHALNFKEQQLIFEDRSLEVYSFPLKHRISCCGFLFKEKKRSPRLNKEAIVKFELEPGQILRLKKGQDVELQDGRKVLASAVLDSPDELRAYAYCSDTMYWESLIPVIQNVNLLYHESTFLDDDQDRAKSTFHSTASQAARIAASGNVKQLLLGHYSSRYKSLDLFTEQARQHFKNTSLSVEGVTYPVQ
jgi:ribonuclease Z